MFFFIQVVFQTYNKEHQARVGIDDLLIIGANITGKIYMFLFDLILYVHSTIFQLCGTVLPGFNQY